MRQINIYFFYFNQITNSSFSNNLFFTFLTIKSVISIAPPQSKTGSSCEWIGSNSGQEPSCLPNWYVNGVCQSKRRPNCKESKLSLKKYTQMMQCCQMKYDNDQDEVCQSAGLVRRASHATPSQKKCDEVRLRRSNFQKFVAE